MSDNEQKKHPTDQVHEVIVITDTDTDDENPLKQYV